VFGVGDDIDIQMIFCLVDVYELRFNGQRGFCDQVEERVAMARVADEQRLVST